ncbi:DUF2971 domain-containing protein [Leptospira noumeaensis]|uniref:DUF2971 domain-containing protein n=1 Tax=Leptospira noumeaensis TaxID=2484964 RepID=A0A4R9IJ94_9LEPT|nr:DUF2971 domain-containing protein [Leptospira noumeaensis]TGK89248.1 DUF2971 domain-containing protein [Leptospira noumeaensis]
MKQNTLFARLLERFFNIKNSHDDLQNPFLNLLKNQENHLTTELIYHYTSLEGLTGILENKELWLSNSISLNDSSEIKYAESIEKEVLSELLESHKDDQLALDFLNSFLESKKLDNQVYIISFTSDSDSLTQWQGYSQNQGVAIGFKKDTLAKYTTQRSNEFFLVFPVIYDKILQKSIFQKYFLDLLRILKEEVKQEKIEKSFHEEIIQILNETVFTALSYLYPYFKHTAFKQEQEWRFVLINHKSKYQSNKTLDISFRSGKNKLIPFVKIKLTKADTELSDLPISNIIVGPGPFMKNFAESIELYKKEKGESFDVKRSEIPYRP